MMDEKKTGEISNEQKSTALTQIGLLKECFKKETEQLPVPMDSGASIYFQHEGRQRAWDAFRKKTGLVVPVEDVSILRQASKSAKPPTGLSGVMTSLMLFIDQKSKQRRPLSLVEGLGTDDGNFGMETRELLESGLKDPDIIDALAHSPELIHGCNAYLSTNPNTREETLKKLLDYGSEGINSSQQYLSEAVANREDLSLEMAYEMRGRYQDPFRGCHDTYNRSKFDWSSFNNAETVAYERASHAMYEAQEVDPDAKWDTKSKLPPFSEFKDLYGAAVAKNVESTINGYLDVGGPAKAAVTEEEIVEAAKKAPITKWVRLGEHLNGLEKVGALKDGEKFHKGWAREIITMCPQILKEAGQKTDELQASLLAKVSDISRPQVGRGKGEVRKTPLQRKQEVASSESQVRNGLEGK